jgi:DNA-binding beta-propeller fold protein YncE
MVAAMGVLIALLSTGCQSEVHFDGEPRTFNGFLCTIFWLKGLSGVQSAIIEFDDNVFYPQFPGHLPQTIQGLGTTTSSVRTGVSGGSSPSLRLLTRPGERPAVASGSPVTFSTNAYILDTVSLFQMDPSTGLVLRSLDLTAGQAGSPSRFAITSDGKFAIVSNENGRNHPYILLVDLGSFTVAATIQIPENANAYGVAITPDNKFAYVVTQSLSTAQDSVYVIDLTARQIATTIPLPKYSSLQNIVMTPDGTAVYLNSGVGGDFQIPLIDTASNTVTMDVSTIYYSPSTGTLLPGAAAYMAMHPDGTRLYLAPIDGGPIFVLSTATNLVTKLIQVPQGAASPAGTAPVFTPDGRFLFVLDGPGAFCMVDTATDTVRLTIPLDPSITSAAPGSAKMSFYFVPGP